MANQHRSSRKNKIPASDLPYRLFVHSLADMGDERYADAITSFERYLAKETDPLERANGLQNLAACFLETGQYAQSLDRLDQLDAIVSEQTAPSKFLRGVILARSGRFGDAQTIFEAYSRQYPNLARQINLKDTRRLIQAIVEGKKAPGTFLAEQLQTYLDLNIDFGDFELVERKALQMIEADPGRAQGHFALGIACIEGKRYDESLSAFQEAHRLMPKHAITLYNIGFTLLEMGESVQAIPWLEKAARQDSKHLGAWEMLGRAFRQTDQPQEAIRAWKMGLRVAPDATIFQNLLHEIGAGPEPKAESLPLYLQRYYEMVKQAKSRMRQPQRFVSSSVTLTVEPGVGFTLEDSQNPVNVTIYAGRPFEFGKITDADLLDFMGGIKLAVRMIGGENTREAAILTHYQDGSKFHYKTRIERGRRVEHNVSGRFVVTQIPDFFKVRMDADFATPYADPMCGRMIYLRQGKQTGIMVNTFGQELPKNR